MSAMANLLVKDDATSPVEITFVPITDTPTPFWRAGIAGVPLDGQPRFTVTQERVKSGAYKYTAKLEVPVMETLGASGTSAGYVAPPSVAYVMVGIATLFAPARSTNGDRANVLKMLVGLLQGASSTTATGILNNANGTNVWGTSVLPVTEAFTKLLLPN
jgi:hypothetical protein